MMTKEDDDLLTYLIMNTGEVINEKNYNERNQLMFSMSDSSKYI